MKGKSGQVGTVHSTFAHNTEPEIRRKIHQTTKLMETKLLSDGYPIKISDLHTDIQNCKQD